MKREKKKKARTKTIAENCRHETKSAHEDLNILHTIDVSIKPSVIEHAPEDATAERFCQYKYSTYKNFSNGRLTRTHQLLLFLPTDYPSPRNAHTASKCARNPPTITTTTRIPGHTHGKSAWNPPTNTTIITTTTITPGNVSFSPSTQPRSEHLPSSGCPPLPPP